MKDNGKFILDIIENSSRHLTAEDIHAQLKADSHKMAIATVYNNLGSLYSEGKIRKISLVGQPDFYDKLTRHDHMVCSQCGKISDFCLEDLTSKIEETTGVHLDFYELRAYYVCNECKQNINGGN